MAFQEMHTTLAGKILRLRIAKIATGNVIREKFMTFPILADIIVQRHISNLLYMLIIVLHNIISLKIQYITSSKASL